MTNHPSQHQPEYRLANYTVKSVFGIWFILEPSRTTRI